MREFSSGTPKGAAPVPVKEVKFSLDKVVFTCILRQDADSILGWSELAGSASHDDDLETAEGAAFVSKFFQLVMDPLEYRRFRSHLRKHETSPEVLEEIMSEIDAAMRDGTEEKSERPTVPPSSSSGGRQVKDARRQQIALLAGSEDADVVVAPPPNREARRKLEREQRSGAQPHAVASV